MATDLRIIPRNYGRQTNDIAGDTLGTARFIGNIVQDKTRLTVASALTGKDGFDFFYFDVRTAGKIGIAPTTDGEVQIQIVERANGRIIADSAATLGEKADNWFDAIAGKLELSQKQYALKVTRTPGSDASAKPNYVIQLQMGDAFTEDYDTIEKPQIASAAPTITSLLGTAQSNLTGMLAGDNRNQFGLIDFFV